MRVLRAGDATVVIDETFVELNLDDVEMPPPAASFGDARTITIGSLSKPVWGGLRIGWLRADPSTVQRIAALRAITDMASPVLEQLVAVGVFEVLDAIVAERKVLLRARRSALAAALDEHAPAWKYTTPHGGLFLWVELPSPSATSLSLRAQRARCLFHAGPAVRCGRTARPLSATAVHAACRSTRIEPSRFSPPRRARRLSVSSKRLETGLCRLKEVRSVRRLVDSDEAVPSQPGRRRCGGGTSGRRSCARPLPSRRRRHARW